jgi:hypothetical protein
MRSICAALGSRVLPARALILGIHAGRGTGRGACEISQGISLV